MSHLVRVDKPTLDALRKLFPDLAHEKNNTILVRVALQKFIKQQGSKP